LITAAMRRARPGVMCAAADGPEAALRAASGMAAGSPVLFLYEKLEMARQALAAIGARPCPADTGPASTRPSPAASIAGTSRPTSPPPRSGPLRRSDRDTQWNRGHY
jgi:cyanophycin synthetase